MWPQVAPGGTGRMRSRVGPGPSLRPRWLRSREGHEARGGPAAQAGGMAGGKEARRWFC
jgi:hypothetical protein